MVVTSEKARLFDSVDVTLDEIRRKWSKEGIFVPSFRGKSGNSILVAPEDYVDFSSGKEFFSWYDLVMFSREMVFPKGWRLPTVLDIENIFTFYQGYSLPSVLSDELQLKPSLGAIPGAEMIAYNSAPNKFHYEMEKSLFNRKYVYWTLSVFGFNSAYCFSVGEDDEKISFSVIPKWSGCRVRLVKDV